MQGSLIDFDDLLEPPAADAAQTEEVVDGVHQVQQTGAITPAADASDLCPTSAVGQHVEAYPAASDPFIDLMSSEQQRQQADQQHAPNQQQQEEAVVFEQLMHESIPQEQQQQQQQQQQTNQQHAGSEQAVQAEAGSAQHQPNVQACQQHSSKHSSSMDPSLLPVCERVACLGQLLQQHGAAQGEANASIR
jgi:hypothetical protein